MPKVKREYNPEYAKQYREKNKEVLKEKGKLYYLNNTEKQNAYNKQWRLNNQNKVKNKNLSYKYGISIEDYNKLFEQQEGCCAICDKHQQEFKKALSVDHCHDTGKVRGLLCQHCNSVLGLSKDNIEVLQAAINYLVKELV
jgi:hypothetical protein